MTKRHDLEREAQRLTELEQYDILDTLPEQVYEDIVALAAEICGTSIALISFVDDERQWFKAKIGLEESETIRSISFCTHAIERRETMVVPDATQDERFANNPLVTGPLGIRFYAGAPLRAPSGAMLGTLCVIDKFPRELSDSQKASLERLSRGVVSALELRRSIAGLEKIANERDAHAKALRDSKQQADLVLAATQVGIWDWNVQNGKVFFSDRWKQLLGYRSDEIGNDETEWSKRIHPDDLDGVIAWAQAGLKQDKPYHREYRMVHKDGTYRWYTVRAITVLDEHGEAVRAVGSMLDINARKKAESDLRASHARIEKLLDRVTSLSGLLTPDGVLIDANEAVLRVANLTADQVLNLPFDQTYWFNHSETVKQQVKDGIRDAAAGLDARFDCKMRAGDHDYRMLDLSIRPLHNDAGEIEYLVASALDVTERRRAEEKLHEEKERAQITLSSIGDGVITTNEAGVIDSINPTAQELTGFSTAEAVGKKISEVFRIINESTREPLANPLEICLADGKSIGLANHTILLRADGSEISIDDSAGPIRTQNGTVVGAVLIFRDVTEQRRLAKRVSRQASHDALTDLPNRHEFERRLALMLNSAINNDVEHAICYLDLDQFKIINDTCGHAAGDAMLAQLGSMLKTKVRQRDTLARLGGDEFGLILGNCPLDWAINIANDIKNSICDFRFHWEQHVFSVGVSIGLTPINRASGDIATILSAADSACYAAKEKGRNQIQVYETHDCELAATRGEMRWINRIQEALHNDRLTLYLQDIVSVNGRQDPVPRREALLRLIDEEGVVHKPGAFLPAAERYGEIEKIDRLVFGKVCDILEATEDTDKFLCNVNISGPSLGNADFLEFVTMEIESRKINSQRLCFEITETAAISNLHAAQRFLSALRRKGCRFALDDFGSGLSSFNYLKTLPIDTIKIDGSFIRDMISDPVDAAMVEAIQKVAKIMGIKTVAEHVENSDTVAALRTIGIDDMQGYLIAKPRPFELPEKA